MCIPTPEMKPRSSSQGGRVFAVHLQVQVAARPGRDGTENKFCGCTIFCARTSLAKIENQGRLRDYVLLVQGEVTKTAFLRTSSHYTGVAAGVVNS
jgi:hypothetical protein